MRRITRRDLVPCVAHTAKASRGLRSLVLAAIVLPLLFAAGHTGAQEPGAVHAPENVKAAFLYHFATYVNWPEDATSDDVFRIAVLGADPVADELEEFLPGRTLNGLPMEVRRLGAIEDLGGDEVLYIGPGENRHLEELLDAVRSRPVLVVTDAPDGLPQGATINFRIVDNRVRFEISLRAAQRSGLELSSRLLSAAMSVEAAGAIIRIDYSKVSNDWRALAARRARGCNDLIVTYASACDARSG